MVHQIIIIRDSDRIFTAGSVQQIKCLYKGFNSVCVMGIQVIESQNPFY